MKQINIMLLNGTRFILAEDEIIESPLKILKDYQTTYAYLIIDKKICGQLVLNKKYIVAINVEEADRD